MKVGIITIGNELLSGFTLDRNAAWIGQKLLSSGIKVNVHHTIPDDIGVIYDTLEYQLKEWECDQIIVTGGLGPTVMILQYLLSLNTLMMRMNLIKSIGKSYQIDLKS